MMTQRELWLRGTGTMGWRFFTQNQCLYFMTFQPKVIWLWNDGKTWKPWSVPRLLAHDTKLMNER